MDVYKAIERRRAYRSLKPVEITDEIIKDLAYHASLAPSCYNKQPWRFIFVRDPGRLKEVFKALPDGNSWAKAASMVIAVYSRRDLDCIIGEREYYLFDTGMAVAFLLLRATELGLVAHPIAGYDPEKVKRTLKIPEDMNLITLIVVGEHSEEVSEVLSGWQREQEERRPRRLDFEEFSEII